jgi:hypothetical protein
MTRSAVIVPVDRLSPADVHVAQDHHQRTVVLVPDHIAVQLYVCSRQAWRDVPDMNTGSSGYQPLNSPAVSAAAVILDAVIAADLPRPAHWCGSTDAETAAHGDFYGMVVGASAWSVDDHWFARDYKALQAEHLVGLGSLHLDRHGVHWSG